MPSLPRSCVALALFLVSTPAFADAGFGCRCDSTSLVGAALILPVVAFGVLLSRRGARRE